MNQTKFNINDLSTWPMALTAILALVISFVIFYIINTAFISNTSNSITKKSAEIEKLSRNYQRDQRKLAPLAGLKKELEELSLLRDKVTAALPTEVSMPSLIDNVYNSARKNSIVFRSFTPNSDINTPYYTIKPISLSADIGYISMADFIQEVTAFERIMNIESVSFSRQSEYQETPNTPLSMNAQLRTYIFKNN